ncbi:LDLR chaperone MESD [Aphelenchoides besseyi]|nr:LDLR chaperone MESD [Aphelenchoides besseyi]
MRRTAALVTVLLVVFVVGTEAQKKKKDPRDYTDADLERLYEEWEENDEDVLPDDEKPDYEKPRKDINVEELQKEANSPDDLLRLSKKGQAIMMFITVTEGTDGKATRPFTDRMSQLWQSNLYNNHIDVQSYVVEDDRILFLFKDGSRAWEGRDYILKQPNCLDITLEGNTIPGAGSKKHTEL